MVSAQRFFGAFALIGVVVAVNPNGEDECSLVIEGFNLPLSVASIFVIFVSSMLGAGLPGLLSFSEHPKILTTTKILAYAGTGVILSTSFIHLLLPAQETLSSPCLPELWLTSYPSYAFLLSLITITFMFISDHIVTSFILETLKDKEPTVAPTRNTNCAEGSTSAASTSAPGACKVHSPCKDEECGGRPLLTVVPRSPIQYIAVILAEISIAVHSVVIGLVLGVAPASEIPVLLIALTFHQMLEGVALGSAAIDACFSRRAYGILVLAFSLTTPIGTAIGIGVRSSMNPNGTGTLLAQGILDAICSGMLIYLSFEHLNAFKSHAVWLRQQGSLLVTVSCLMAFAAGVAIMAAIGFWA